MTNAPTSCRTCGTDLLPNARFCHGCGSPVEEPARAEYKQVTVLFADVVGSMSIAAAVGPERLREIMAELVSRCAAVVQRYGGTMDKFTGDGLMAVFGAPVTLEDHAIRACLAAMGIQSEARQLADEVHHDDKITVQVRVGLNSGQVIAGEMGSGVSGYTAIGEHVGYAQRMESVAPPGGVVLSESTAHLVRHVAVLDEPEVVQIKDSDRPVYVRRLVAIEPRRDLVGGPETSLFGRDWEMAAVEGILNRTLHGRGGVLGVVGPPGIGKSRVAREAAAMAAGRGAEVFWTFCESHASQMPFNVLSRLMRATSGIAELDSPAARERVRTRTTNVDEQDLLLLDELLDIADPDRSVPAIDPDARRRRLTAMINAASLARTRPALYIIEDVHWIDEASESMLAEFVTVIPHTPSMVLITYRPEYRGALAPIRGAQTIALAPLDNSDIAALTTELLGADPSVEGLATTIVSRVDGNPFFAEEMVRDLAERGVLTGRRGAYVCQADDIEDIAVPATLQATIGARIDRLDRQAKRTLSAAAVIGSPFDAELLGSLGVDPALDELMKLDLIDQVRYTPHPEYVFRHPLIRTVAYESQLKADRAELHRRVACAIEEHSSGDENAALIAEHLDAAGDNRAAYDWHMRAGYRSTRLDIATARANFERARQIADALPDIEPNRTTMRIAPRAVMCGTAWWGLEQQFLVDFDVHFRELRELCTAADDKASLAMGMGGMTFKHMLAGRVRAGAVLAAEHLALLESIDDPTLTAGSAAVAVHTKFEVGEVADIMRWSQAVIDSAAGDPVKGIQSEGNLRLGSPLAVALAWRGIARWCTGDADWRRDLDLAMATARQAEASKLAAGGAWSSVFAAVAGWKHRLAVISGVLPADDHAVCELDEGLRIAESLKDDSSAGSVKYALGVVLTHRNNPADRERGLRCLDEVREMCEQQRFLRSELPVINLYAAREQVRRGDRDAALPVIREAVQDMVREGQIAYGIPGTAVLVETLLDHCADGDVAEAESVIERLAGDPNGEGLVARDVTLLRLRALLARARGDDVAYRKFVHRYRSMAKELGFEGHIAMAEAM